MDRRLAVEIKHNMREKIFPDGSREILIASAPIFRESGWERADKWEPEPREKGSADNANLARSKRRAKQRIHDLSLANPDFRYFVTLTLNAEVVDRYNMSEVVKKLNRWADNRVRRNGLKYILIPELHKDGAIHFHGFFNDALALTDSGTLIPPGGGKPKKPRSHKQREEWLSDGAHTVFNIPGWSYGFSTAIELYGERRAAVGYVCKYVSKALEKIGGRWYYSGGQLQEPQINYSDVDIEAIDFSDGWVLEALNCRCVTYSVGGGARFTMLDENYKRYSNGMDSVMSVAYWFCIDPAENADAIYYMMIVAGAISNGCTYDEALTFCADTVGKYRLGVHSVMRGGWRRVLDANFDELADADITLHKRNIACLAKDLSKYYTE